ncbi:MAG: LUD domain-containing protein [Gemmatimonadetes bacterium]|nr:LUD domain-containing protein [Gemmatimonadota bacterium]
MSARDVILTAIRAARVPPAPPAEAKVEQSADLATLREQFLRALTEVGGHGTMRLTGQSVDALLDTLLGANRAHTMIVRGRFAVAENAAVYVDAADLAQRNDIVREERMVVIVPADAVVPTMHEAMRLVPAGPGCGWFLSGPSKTADIEQSLVFGAQGSRAHYVILDADENAATAG